MRDIRVADDIFGLWAAVPMPWTSDGKLDAGMLERNIARLADVPVDGIYSTDSDGEFYALELDEFRAFVSVFARCMRSVDCGVQVGVTWTNTQGIIDRIKVCLDHGISTVHVCYPYWMPLNRQDVKRFWADLADAAPDARWVHYNTPRGHVAMGAAEYRRLADDFPQQFIGTKLSTKDFHELSQVITSTPHIAHVLTDFTIVPGMMLGGRGSYSFWVNTLPRWHRRLLDLCRDKRWDEAMAMQVKFNNWEARCVGPIVAQGYLHGIVGKIRVAASGFLEDSGYTRSPYQPAPQALADQLASDFRQWWHEEAEAERAAMADESDRMTEHAK